MSNRGNRPTLWESLQQGQQMAKRGLPLGYVLVAKEEHKRAMIKASKKKRGK